MTIPFNIPFICGDEALNMQQVLNSKKICGDGSFTKKCHQFFETRFGIKKALLTTSCTDALELSSILTEIQPDDEVIMPSFTFVSTANPFLLRGAKIVFADSEHQTPNMDVSKIEALITPKTKAIVPVHYAGVACDMDPLLEIAKKYNLVVIEDAAHSIDSYYKGAPLGSLGDMGTFSFHETKNIIAGEGGLLTINNPRFMARAEIVREKGTNRAQFFRGEVDKYGWVDIGSSFLPSELIASFLMAQLENLERIQKRRLAIWSRYYSNLISLMQLRQSFLPYIPAYATNNAHMFYLRCSTLDERTSLIDYLNKNGVKATFHYSSLHNSTLYKEKHDSGRVLKESDQWSDQIIRLPMFYDLTDEQVDYICDRILSFYHINDSDTLKPAQSFAECGCRLNNAGLPEVI